MSLSHGLDKAIVVKIAWNSNGWVGQSTNPRDWKEARFSDVKERHSAHEWWNFTKGHPQDEEGYVYGHFHPKGGTDRPNLYPDDRLAVFFTSRDLDQGRKDWVVGAYLQASYRAEGWEVKAKADGGFKSFPILRCPEESVWVMPAPKLLALDAERHLRGKVIGNANFTYLEAEHVRNLLLDMKLAVLGHMERLSWQVL